MNKYTGTSIYCALMLILMNQGTYTEDLPLVIFGIVLLGSIVCAFKGLSVKEV